MGARGVGVKCRGDDAAERAGGLTQLDAIVMQAHQAVADHRRQYRDFSRACTCAAKRAQVALEIAHDAFDQASADAVIFCEFVAARAWKLTVCD